MAANTATPLWSEWRRVTRFLESARLAFAREQGLWQSLEIASPAAVQLVAPRGSAGGTYSVALDDHLKALADEETLMASVLIHSYALAESAATSLLGLDPRHTGGIESWGASLLRNKGTDWQDVLHGKAGMVEVAVVRDVYAHGSRTVDGTAASRLAAAASPDPPALTSGSVVMLDHPTVCVYRDRLRSLLRLGGC
jgi:hypothetical protein